MQIQQVGSTLMVHLSRRELHRRGMEPESLGLREILLLSRDAFGRAGVPIRCALEVEAYPERGGALLFIHLKEEEKEWFRFETLMDALDALAQSGEPDGEMAYWEGYYMSGHDEVLRQRLSEFGEAVSVQESGAVEEQAALVFDRKGLRRLWERIRRE